MFEKRIAKGMQWLDENHPGWISKIDLATFNLCRGCHCVLGQLFPAKSVEGWSSYVLALETLGKTKKWAYEHGFEASMEFDDYAKDMHTLDSEWKASLRERLSQTTPAPAGPAERPAANVALTAVCLR